MSIRAQTVSSGSYTLHPRGRPPAHRKKARLPLKTLVTSMPVCLPALQHYSITTAVPRWPGIRSFLVPPSVGPHSPMARLEAVPIHPVGELLRALRVSAEGRVHSPLAFGVEPRADSTTFTFCTWLAVCLVTNYVVTSSSRVDDL